MAQLGQHGISVVLSRDVDRRDKQLTVTNTSLKQQAEFVVSIPIVDGPYYRLQFGRQTIHVNRSRTANDLGPLPVEMLGGQKPINHMIFGPAAISLDPQSQHAPPCRHHLAIPEDWHNIEGRTRPIQIVAARRKKNLATTREFCFSVFPGVRDQNVSHARLFT